MNAFDASKICSAAISSVIFPAPLPPPPSSQPQTSSAPINLFEADGTTVTYKGQYKLDSIPYRYERSLDFNGNDRRVIVFHLVQS